MATQGLVSIVEGEKVLMKVVAGSDGYNADAFVEILRDKWPCDAQKAYEIALDIEFGDFFSLVVITESTILHQGEHWEDDSMELYRETFQRPEFNPRLPQGTVEYLRVIQL